MKRRQMKNKGRLCDQPCVFDTAHLCFYFPLVWILISSVKGKGELTGNPTAFWPRTWTLDYYTT